MTENKKWTEKEIEFLKENSDKLTSKEIAIKLERGEYSVSNAYRRFNIKKDKGTILKEKYKKGIFVGPNKGKKLPYLTKRNLENNPMNNLITKAKANKSINEGFRNGRKVWNKDLSGEEYLKHYGDGETWLIKQQKDKSVQRKFIDKSLKTKKERGSMPKGKTHHLYGKTKDNCPQLKKVSERMLNGGALKARKANKVSPNKPEKIIIKLIKQYNLNFIYVGNRKKWFKGKTQSFNPDFINEDEKKIIEFFGDYWHNLPKSKIRDKERLKTYTKYGYKTLVILGHELTGRGNGKKLSEEQIINKIKNF